MSTSIQQADANAESSARVFLSAEWRMLVILNFQIDPAVLQPIVPQHTELDFEGRSTYVSMVGFRFLHTRVLGIAFPFHRNFDEVNLRFYVRRRTGSGWRRGVVFIRELVPRLGIAATARLLYGEPYAAVPMRHTIGKDNGIGHARYEWKWKGRWQHLAADYKGEPHPILDGSHEEWITEHYWGYNGNRRSTAEYQVEHPRWSAWPAVSHSFDADIASLYGEPFRESLSSPPASAFIAEGSPVTVRLWRRPPKQAVALSRRKEA